MRTITVTEGLVELKLLDSRINKAIDREWCVCVKRNDPHESKDKFNKEVLASYQSVLDLMKERKNIKSAIVESNAKTILKVGETEMTVAEAIERKSSIGYERMLLHKWKNQLSEALRHEKSYNDDVQHRLDNLLQNIASSDKSDLTEATTTMAENYMAMNGAEILDPLKLAEEIEELDSQIDEFMGNVDTALSLSNAVTMIEV